MLHLGFLAFTFHPSSFVSKAWHWFYLHIRVRQCPPSSDSIAARSPYSDPGLNWIELSALSNGEHSQFSHCCTLHPSCQGTAGAPKSFGEWLTLSLQNSVKIACNPWSHVQHICGLCKTTLYKSSKEVILLKSLSQFYKLPSCLIFFSLSKLQRPASWTFLRINV